MRVTMIGAGYVGLTTGAAFAYLQVSCVEVDRGKLAVLKGGGCPIREPGVGRLPEQPGDVPQTWADVEKAGRLLGYRPRTRLDDGIGRFVEWLKSDERIACAS